MAVAEWSGALLGWERELASLNHIRESNSGPPDAEKGAAHAPACRIKISKTAIEGVFNSVPGAPQDQAARGSVTPTPSAQSLHAASSEPPPDQPPNPTNPLIPLYLGKSRPIPLLQNQVIGFIQTRPIGQPGVRREKQEGPFSSGRATASRKSSRAAMVALSR